MRRKRGRITLLTALATTSALCLAATTVCAQSITVGSVSGAAPGSTVSVDVTIQVPAAVATPGVAGAQNDITFDPVNAPIGTVCLLDNTVKCSTDQDCITASGDPTDKCNVPDCTPNTAIKKESTQFAFRPPECSGTACTGVRALVFSQTAAQSNRAIPDGSVLYSCNVKISSSPTGASFPLTVSNVVMSKPANSGCGKQCAISGATGVSGSVSIGPALPTNTPGGEATATPTTGGATATPTTGEATATPTTGGATATPTTGEATATPTTGGVTATPTTGGATATPTIGGATATPTTGGATATPTTGEATATPTTGGATATPTTGGATATPTTGGATATQTTGGATATPTTGGATATPTIGGATATPTIGGATATPTTGGATATPTSGGATATATSKATATATPAATATPQVAITLTNAITAADTTLTVSNASSLPSSGTVLIDSELINYSGKSGNQLTGLTRGASGTTVAAHAAGVKVTSVPTGGINTEDSDGCQIGAVGGGSPWLLLIPAIGLLAVRRRKH